MRLLATGLLAVLLGSAACSSTTVTAPSSSSTSSSSGSSGATEDPPTDQPASTTLFTNQVKSVIVEIDYAPGAEPFQGTIKKFGDPWGLLPMNASVIFDGKKTVSMPTTVDKMEKLADVTATTFTRADLSAIAAAHRTTGQFADVASFYIVFLNGNFVDETGAVQADLLGYSVGRTGVIAIFKPAIKDALVEQLTLVHQLGHAVGFVDDGVPVTDVNRAHVDPADGHHCTNTGCAMNVANERAAGAEAFAAKIAGPQSILIGQECLSDARILENTTQ